MGSKRKQQTPAHQNSRKRQKGLQSSPPAAPHPHGEVDPEKTYAVRSIIDERPGQYRIDWEDDPETGENYEPTWEPRRLVNKPAVDEWKQQKAARARRAQQAQQTLTSELPSSSSPTAKPKGRPRKVIDSSPEVSPKVQRSQQRLQPESGEPAFLGTRAVSPPAPVQQPEPEPEIVESQPTDQAEITPDSPLFEPIVEPSDPPSSYLLGGYQKFLSSSQAAPGSESLQPAASSVPATSDGQSRSVPVNFGEGSSRVIPDSQTNIDLTSSAPPAVSSSRSGARDTTPKDVEAVAETPAAVLSSSAPAWSHTGRSSAAPKTHVGRIGEQEPVISPSVVARQQENEAEERPEVTQQKPAVHERADHPTSDPRHSASPSFDKLLAGSHSDTGNKGADIVARSSPCVEEQQATVELNPEVPPAASADIELSKKAAKPESAVFTATTGVGSPRPDKDIVGASQVGIVETVTAPVDHIPHPSIESRADRPPQHESARSAKPAESLATEAGAESGIHESEAPLHLAETASQNPPANSGNTATSSFPFQTQIPRPGISGLSQTSPHSRTPIRLFGTLRGLDGAASQPPPDPSAAYSSPIASVPPYSVGTIGESAPPRPTTLSSSVSPARSSRAMEKSQPSSDAKPSMNERMARLLAERKAKRQSSVPVPASVPGSRPSTAQSQPAAPAISQAFVAAATQLPAAPTSQPPRLVSSLIAEERERRSPSAVPAVEAPEVVSQAEMNTSERYGTLLPQPETNGLRNGPVSGPSLSRQPSKVQEPQMSNSYVVPIALFGHQRDQYSSVTERDMKVIERFLSASPADAHLSREAENILEQKRKVALHPDLVNGETFTPYDVQPEQEAQWYVDCSAKFRFLKELFAGIRNQTLHIAIVTQPGRILDMLDTFLTGITVPHRRMTGVVTNSVVGEDQGLMVTLVSLDDELPQPRPSSADLVIVLDPTVSAECMPIRALTHGDRQAIVITLVVPYTIEHLEQSISTALPDHTRLRTLMAGFSHYRNDAGKLEDGQLAVSPAAKALAEYLAAQEGDREWPLVILAPLETVDSQTESDIEPPATQDEQDLNNGTGLKRALDADDASNEPRSAKKARPEPHTVLEGMQAPPMTINPQDLDITHISDSVAKPTQPHSESTAAAEGLLQTQTEQSLHRMLQETQTRLDEHVQSLSQVQYDYEDLRQKLVVATRAGEDTIAAAQTLQDRATKAEQKLLALRIEHAEVKQQLTDANACLLDQSIPERAELENMRARAEFADSEKALVENRLARLTKEHEYLRDGYQTVSQGSQSMATQVSELENSLAVVQNRATGEQARLRQMGYDAQTKNLRNENKKLKAMLRDRDAAMKFRDEEIARLKEASRGRMGTRGTSVPRSPRLGSPMKMADGALRGRGSRQGSPSAGDLRLKGTMHLHPLRNG